MISSLFLQCVIELAVIIQNLNGHADGPVPFHHAAKPITEEVLND